MAGVAVALDATALETQLRGELIRPDDARYEEARKVYNAMIDKRPALIARCRDTADVIAAVNFARESGLELAVRCGTHNVAGLGTVDDGLVIDLSPMKGIRVDPAGRTVEVQGGCTWGDVDHATHAFGLATPGGVISTTGVAGLTLGGGSGYLTRRCGLCIDNMLSADVVLADGSFVTASGQENEDLFWALRGGGGNFGVVTSLTLRLHDVHTIIGGPTLWSLEHAAEVMRFYDEYMAAAPDEIYGVFAFLTVPPGPPFPEELHLKKMCGIVWHYTGPDDKADAVFAPVLEIGPPALHGVGPMPHPALQSAFDALYPPGLYQYWRADFLDGLSDEAIARHVEHAKKLPTPLTAMHLYPIDGAAGRVGRNETAYSYRESRFSEVIFAVDPDPSKQDLMKSWVIDYWEAVHPYSAGGAYVNFMMEEGQERIRATYRDNYDRLAEIKRRYDPTNLFHVNQNIPPA